MDAGRPPRLDAPLPDSGTDGLRLRPIEIADAAAWHAYLALPETTRHTSWALRGPADIEALIAGYLVPSATPSATRYALVDAASGQLAGTLGLNEICAPHARAEIAYDLDPRWRGRGIARRACAALTDWALAQGWHRIQATVLDTNLASRRVLEHCAYVNEGLLRGYRRVRGQPRDFWLYARVAGDGR